jgi:hypothetical protein
MNTNFTDPYSGDKKNCLRCSIHLGRDDLGFLKSLDPEHHSRATTFGILFTKLIHELKRNNITEYDPARYRTAIGGLTITLGQTERTNDPGRAGSPPSLSNAHQSDSRDDGRGVAAVPQPAQAAPSVDAGITIPPKRKRRTSVKAVANEGEGVGS